MSASQRLPLLVVFSIDTEFSLLCISRAIVHDPSVAEVLSLGRSICRAFMRDANVDGGTPKASAAPCWPATFHPARSSAWTIFWRSLSPRSPLVPRWRTPSLLLHRIHYKVTSGRTY